MSHLTRMHLNTALPFELATDPDFALASLLTVDARIAANLRYGPGVTLQFHTARITIELTSLDHRLPELLYVEIEWDVALPATCA